MSRPCFFGKNIDTIVKSVLELAKSANVNAIVFDQLELVLYVNVPSLDILIKNAKKLTKDAKNANPKLRSICPKSDILEWILGAIGNKQRQLLQEIEDSQKAGLFQPESFLNRRLCDLEQFRQHVAFLHLYNAAALLEYGVVPSKDVNGMRAFPSTSADLQAVQREHPLTR